MPGGFKNKAFITRPEASVRLPCSRKGIPPSFCSTSSVFCKIAFIRLDFPHPFAPFKNTRSFWQISKQRFSNKGEAASSYCRPYWYAVSNFCLKCSKGLIFKSTGHSISWSNPSFSSISRSRIYSGIP